MVWISVECVVITPLGVFIASIWFLCLFFFIRLASDLSILLIFCKKQLLDVFIVWMSFCVSISFSSALVLVILVISCLLLAFEFFWSCSSSSFNLNDRVLILDFYSLLMRAFIAINFPLDTALNVSQRFWYIVSSFSLVSKNIFISAFISLFIQLTFRSQFFSFHEVVQFLVSLYPSVLFWS